MKKTFALAVPMLALAGLSHAQSSVTLYGLLDLNVSNYDSGDQANAGNVTRLNDGTVNGLNGSRWGLRVSEDLGGGLRAGAVLEGGILVDTGSSAQGGRAFGRQAFISLAHSSLGEVRLGRQYILEDSVMFQSNPFGNALTLNPSTSVTNMGRNLPLWLNAPRADNVVQYQTPSLAGLTLAGQIAPGEGTADRFHGVRAAYANGPVNAAVSYEWNDARSGVGNTNKSLTLAGNYNFGVFKLLGGYQRNEDLTTNSGNGAAVGVSNLIVTGPSTFSMVEFDGYTVGAEFPAGAWLLGANYTSLNYKGAAGQESDLGKVAFGARYSLSKTTFLYSSLSFASGELKEYISEERVIQAGMRMAF